MSANFRLIPDSAQRDTDKLTAKCAGDGATQGGFPHSRRPDQTQDGSFQLPYHFLDGQVLQHPFFRLFQAVMILIQNFFRFFQVQVIFGLFQPWKLQQPFNICANHTALSGRGGIFSNRCKFFLNLFFHFLWRFQLGQLLPEVPPLPRYALLFLPVPVELLSFAHGDNILSAFFPSAF